MIKTWYREICAGNNIRQNLISLKEAASKTEGRRELAYLLSGDFHVLTALLENRDPKVRKNAALLLGAMETEDVLPALFKAYEKEETLYVRASYLRAASELDCRPYLAKLHQRMKELEESPAEEENSKHLQDERSAISDILLRYEKIRKHQFTGMEKCCDVILMTNRMQREATASQIKVGTVSMLGGGVKIAGASLKEILEIRTWKELLLPLPGAPMLQGTGAQIGRALARLNIPAFLDGFHEGGGTYFYRLEIKGSATIARKGEMVRGIVSVLDSYSGGALRNSPSDYEVELRLTMRKDGSYVPMIKLFTLRDHRFAYREKTIAESIAPDNAALAMRLAMPYLKEGAQVLDPFCGVGTMLIERRLAVPSGDLYGVDILEEAIEGARINADHIGMKIAFIHRDFFDFTHNYLFDELITDLPMRADEDFCKRFFRKAGQHLKEGAVLVLYTSQGKLIRSTMGQGFCSLMAGFKISERTETEVLVLQYHGKSFA